MKQGRVGRMVKAPKKGKLEMAVKELKTGD